MTSIKILKRDIKTIFQYFSEFITGKVIFSRCSYCHELYVCEDQDGVCSKEQDFESHVCYSCAYDNDLLLDY